MDYQEWKSVMRAKARLARGLVNLLEDDTKQIFIDVEDLDMFSLKEAICEAKRTSQTLMDTITDLERDLRYIKQDA